MQRTALTVVATLTALGLSACGGHAGSPKASSGQTSTGVAPTPSEGITALAVVPSGQIEFERGRGKAFQILVDGHYRDHAAPLDLTRRVTFTVEDESICSISGDGLIAPIGTGVTTVRVSWEGPEGQVLETATEVSVSGARAVRRTRLAAPAPIDWVKLEIYPPYRTLAQVDVESGVRQRQQLLVLGTDANGRRHDLTRQVAIEVLDPDAEPTLIDAHVSPTGLLTGAVNGEIFTVVRMPNHGLLAASHFVLGNGQASPVDTSRFYSGFPLAGSANPLDQAILANLMPLRLEPAPLASDGEFLRRLFGDTLDRAPTAAELAAFEADAEPTKRALEIDRVLATPEFSARWASVIGEWFEMPRRARVLGDVGQRFDLTSPNNTISIAVDGGAAQTITFVAADFPNQGIADALAQEVVNKINQSLQGARAVREGAFVGLVSEPGYGSSLAVVVGGGAAVLGLAGKTNTVLDTWARDALDVDTSLAEMVAQLVRGEVPAFEQANPSAADKVDVIMQATTGMTAKCAKCHDHPLTGANDPIKWTQQERYPIDAFFAATPEEATAYDARTGQRFGPPLEPAFVLAPNAPVNVTLSSPLAQRRAALAQILPQSAAFQRGLGHRVFAEVATSLLDPNQFLQRNLDAVVVPNVFQAVEDGFAQSGSSLRGFLRLVFNSSYYQLSSEDGGRHLQQSDPYLFRRTLRLRHAEVIDAALDEVTGSSLTAPADLNFLHETFGYPFRRLSVSERRGGVNLSQALLLLNSPVVHQRLAGGGSTVADLAAQVDSGALTREEAVEALFHTAFSRAPDQEELDCSLVAIDAAANVEEGLTDVAAALVGAAEFSLD